jgi:hypothetical protein
MEPEPMTSTNSDPLKAVADAMDAAVKAAKDGAESARATAVDALPVANQMVSRLVYKTCYSLSYGVVFSSVLVARSIPRNNAAVHGLIDGAHAALDMVQEMKSRSEAGEPQGGAAPAQGGEATFEPSGV